MARSTIIALLLTLLLTPAAARQQPARAADESEAFDPPEPARTWANSRAFRRAGGQAGLGVSLYSKDGTCLREGAWLEEGDSVSVVIETSAAGYVYLFEKGRYGEAVMLYPACGRFPYSSPATEVMAVQAHRKLELATRSVQHNSDSVAGPFTLVAVFSPTPLDGVPTGEALGSACRGVVGVWPVTDDVWSTVQAALEDRRRRPSSRRLESPCPFFRDAPSQLDLPLPDTLALLDPSADGPVAIAIGLRSNRVEYERDVANQLLQAGKIDCAIRVMALMKVSELEEYAGTRQRGVAPARRSAATPTPGFVRRVAAWTSDHPKKSWQAQYDEIADELTALGAERDAILKKQGLTNTDTNRLDAIDSLLATGATAMEAFFAKLVAVAPETGDARADALRETEALMADLGELGPDVAAVFTLVTDARLWLVVVTPSVRKAVEVDVRREEIDVRVADLRDALASPTTDPRPAAGVLYRLLFAPIEGDLAGAKAKTVAWSLDGRLRHVPIAALYDGERYLVERLETVTISLGSLARLKDAPARPWTGVGLGVSKKVGDAPPLPSVVDELNGIFTTTPDDVGGGSIAGTVRLDERFTSDALGTEALRGSRVVHIATHFHLNPAGADKSLLLLGDGKTIRLSDFVLMPPIFAGVDMVTLSACNTATRSGDGREIDALASIVQRKGAKSVLATLWRVDDRSTSLLMRKFYALRERGERTRKIRALRAAQLALMRSKAADGEPADRDVVHQEVEPAGAGYSHPYYWAPFVLVGNWQ